MKRVLVSFFSVKNQSRIRLRQRSSPDLERHMALPGPADAVPEASPEAPPSPAPCSTSPSSDGFSERDIRSTERGRPNGIAECGNIFGLIGVTCDQRSSVPSWCVSFHLIPFHFTLFQSASVPLHFGSFRVLFVLPLMIEFAGFFSFKCNFMCVHSYKVKNEILFFKCCKMKLLNEVVVENQRIKRG